MTAWAELAKRFQAMAKDCTQAGSYSLNICFDLNYGVFVNLGAYDVPSVHKHVYLGPFKTEELALEATAKFIEGCKS